MYVVSFPLLKAAGDTYIAHHRTATSRGAAHRFLEQTFAPGQYTMPAHQPGAPRLRLITFVVSIRGAVHLELDHADPRLKMRPGHMLQGTSE